MYIKYMGGESTFSIPTGKYSTNYKVEAEALEKAATELFENIRRSQRTVAIFTDAQSVLKALRNPSKDLNELSTALAALCTQVDNTPMAHYGIGGN